jgi:hypothetical protein
MIGIRYHAMGGRLYMCVCMCVHVCVHVCRYHAVGGPLLESRGFHDTCQHVKRQNKNNSHQKNSCKRKQNKIYVHACRLVNVSQASGTKEQKRRCAQRVQVAEGRHVEAYASHGEIVAAHANRETDRRHHRQTDRHNNGGQTERQTDLLATNETMRSS